MKIFLIGTQSAIKKYSDLIAETTAHGHEVVIRTFDAASYGCGWFGRLRAKKALRLVKKGLSDNDLMVVVDDGNGLMMPHWMMLYLASPFLRLAVPKHFGSVSESVRDGIEYYQSLMNAADFDELFRGTTWRIQALASIAKY